MYCNIWGEHIQSADKEATLTDKQEADDLDMQLAHMQLEGDNEQYDYDPFAENPVPDKSHQTDIATKIIDKPVVSSKSE